MASTLVAPVFFELEIKKSRFLTWVEPIDSAQQAKDRLAEIRAQYPDARHVCHAFYVQGSSGMSDDGEPSGTAGKPMFNVLNHKHLVNVLAVVVRYFGGIKLGAGGLSRAYGGAVSQALELAEFQELETQIELALAFPFALESHVRRVIAPFECELDELEYSHQVTASIKIAESKLMALEAAILAVAPGNEALVVQRVD